MFPPICIGLDGIGDPSRDKDGRSKFRETETFMYLKLMDNTRQNRPNLALLASQTRRSPYSHLRRFGPAKFIASSLSMTLLNRRRFVSRLENSRRTTRF